MKLFIALIIIVVLSVAFTFIVDQSAKAIEKLINYIEKHKKPYKNLILFNANPYDKRVNDCSVRAISKILGLTWEEAYDMQTKLARELGTMPNDFMVIKRLLKYNGFEMHDTFNGTIKKFIKLNPKGTYAVCTFDPGHLAYIEKGKLYDTFDSSKFKVGVIFYKR